MELKASTIAAILAICMLAIQSLAQPMLGPDALGEISADKRPKYLETKSPEEFRNAVLQALEELISEGRVNPDIIQVPIDSGKSKRRRYMGFCVKKNHSGAYVPELCWKGEGRR